MPNELQREKSGFFHDTTGLAIFVFIIAIINVLSILFFSILANANLISSNDYFYLTNTGLSISFSLSVLIYLRLFKGLTLKQAVKNLNLNLKKLTYRNVAIGIVVFSILLLMTFLVNVLSGLTSVQISSNAGIIYGTAPFWFYIFSSLIAPINEEMLFRGFLVPRLGIFFSAMIFGVLHYSYNSTFGIEIILAFIFGIIAGYVFKKTKSLYPSIIAHILFNTISLFILS